MALSSMTGFARGHGVAGAYAWSWEIKSVNAKGLDLRLRLPPGWDAIEVPARARAAEKLSRGTVYANLTVERKGVAPAVKVNEPVLAAVLATLKSLARQGRGGAAEARRHSRAQGRDRGHRGGRERGGAPRRRSRDPRRLRQGARRSDRHAPRGGRDARPAAVGAARRDRRAGRARGSGARPQAGSDQGAARRTGGDAAVGLRSASIPTACTRRRSCSPAKADIREELDRLASHVAQAQEADRRRRRRSAAGSIFWRRSSTANRIRSPPRRTTSS